MEVREWLEEVQESRRSRKTERFLGFTGKGLGLIGLLKVCEIGEEIE